MRKAIVVAGVVAFVVIGLVALAAINLDGYLNANRGLVAERVEAALGRKVAFGEVGISWRGGLGVRVSDLHVGDDPAFSKEDFVAAEAVDVRVKLLAALFGRIEVDRVILRAPRVTLIQTAQGLSIDSLGRSRGAEPEAEKGGARSALLVALLDVRDGALRYVDRTVSPAVTLEVDRLDVRASELGFSEPIDFEVSASLFGAAGQNLEAQGRVGPLSAEAPRVDVTLSLDPVVIDEALRVKRVRALLPAGFSGSGPVRIEGKAEGTLEELAFDVQLDAKGAAVRYGESFDKAPGVPLDLAARGTKRGNAVEIPDLRLRFDETKLRGSAKIANLESPKLVFDATSDAVAPGAFGVGEPSDVVRDLDVKGDVALASGGPRGSVSVRSPQGRVRGADYEKLAADIQLRGQRYEIQTLTADAFGGKLSATGTYELRKSGAPRFQLATQLADMRIERLLELVAGPGARLLSGSLAANVDLNGAGSGWEQIRQVLSGNGNLRVSNGVLKELNPAGDTLRALLLVPALSGGGLARFMQKHEKLFREGDTPIDDLASSFEIREGWLQVRDLVVRTSEYVLDGAGRYSLAGQLDFKTALVFSEQLSQELLSAEPALRYARGSDGRVSLPVALRGVPPKVAVLPDVSKLAGSAAREVLSDVVSGALGAKRAPQEGGTAEGAPPQASPGGALGGVLGEVLGVKRAPAQAPVAEPPAAQDAVAPPEAEKVAAPPRPEEVLEGLLRKAGKGDRNPPPE